MSSAFMPTAWSLLSPEARVAAAFQNSTTSARASRRPRTETANGSSSSTRRKNARSPRASRRVRRRWRSCQPMATVNASTTSVPPAPKPSAALRTVVYGFMASS